MTINTSVILWEEFLWGSSLGITSLDLGVYRHKHNSEDFPQVDCADSNWFQMLKKIYHQFTLICQVFV